MRGEAADRLSGGGDGMRGEAAITNANSFYCLMAMPLPANATPAPCDRTDRTPRPTCPTIAPGIGCGCCRGTRTALALAQHGQLALAQRELLLAHRQQVLS